MFRASGRLSGPTSHRSRPPRPVGEEKRVDLRAWVALVVFSAVSSGGLQTTREETSMPGNKKRRIRQRREKTGESYAVARRQLDAAIAPKLAPVKSEWFDVDEAQMSGQGLPRFELVSVFGFDGIDRDKASVPAAAFHDPSMPLNPDWPRETKRVLTLNEYIKQRERESGWKLVSASPGGELTGMFTTVVLCWDTRTKRERGGS